MNLNSTSYFLFALMLATATGCQTKRAAPESFLQGQFSSSISDSEQSLNTTLRCPSADDCSILSTLISKKHGNNTTTINIDKITPVQDVHIAQNALEYAITHRNSEKRKKTYALLKNQLLPALEKKPSIHKCLDLNYPTPKYTLACTLSTDPVGTKTIYYLSTLLAQCNNSFCRYVIFPMERQ